MMSEKSLEIPIKGMDCASCASRIEKHLSSQSGIKKASINFATSKASVNYDENIISQKQIIEKIKELGYKPDFETEKVENKGLDEEKAFNEQKRKFIISLIFSVPVFIISMSMITFPYRNYILLLMTLPVILISGRQFYTGAYKALLNRFTDMNTLIAIGTGSAFIYSLVLTLYPQLFAPLGKTSEVYYEVTTGIITLILLGRMLESKGKR